MMEDHQKDIAAFEWEAQQGQNPAVKAWAAQLVPQLRDHLSQVQKTAQALSSQEGAAGLPESRTMPEAGTGMTR